MFAKRTIPLIIVFTVGVGTFFAWFIPHPPFPSIVNEHAMMWFDIIASFAMILGALNLLKLQSIKIIKKSRNWQYSIAAIGGFVLTIIFGFILKGGHYVILTSVPDNPDPVVNVVLDEIKRTQEDQTYAVVAEGDIRSLSSEPVQIRIPFMNSSEAMKELTKVEQMGGKGEVRQVDDLYYIFLREVPEQPGEVVNYLTDKATELGFDEVFIAGLVVDIRDVTPKEIKIYYYTEGKARKLLQKIRDVNGDGYVTEVQWGGHLQHRGTFFAWNFFNVFTPLSATMFALLAFFVASASYRAFRIRNVEATVLLVAGIILMMGRVPLGSILTGWLPDWLSFLHLPILQEWIYSYPNNAGARAIMIGIALGMVGTSLRVILGIEKSFMGEK